jgi:fibronectin type 3 domain-containing protein
VISASLIGGTAYIDSSVSAGLTYYYVATAVDSSNVESGYSNQAMAIVPSP